MALDRNHGHGSLGQQSCDALVLVTNCDKITPAMDVATREAFLNAIAVNIALGCAADTMLHVPAIALVAGIHIQQNLFP